MVKDKYFVTLAFDKPENYVNEAPHFVEEKLNNENVSIETEIKEDSREKVSFELTIQGEEGYLPASVDVVIEDTWNHTDKVYVDVEKK